MVVRAINVNVVNILKLLAKLVSFESLYKNFCPEDDVDIYSTLHHTLLLDWLAV